MQDVSIRSSPHAKPGLTVPSPFPSCRHQRLASSLSFWTLHSLPFSHSHHVHLAAMTTNPIAAAPVPPPPPASDAQTYLAHPRFHQTFTLPATAEHGALVFSYAEAGREGRRRERGENGEDVDKADEDIPTVLFIPGMFASRYVATWPAVHAVASRMGVRVLAVDRPGMGSSSAVPLAQRVPVWLELVPALLRHLAIRHVALVSHSAGTIFALNTLYRCRDVLHPERPLVALLGKWFPLPRPFAFPPTRAEAWQGPQKTLTRPNPRPLHRYGRVAQA